jgi:diguanylate cyclase (GGDEF)-like protein
VSGLRDLGQRQQDALELFRSSEEARLLARLAQTECLLELAKLPSMRVDLASYAGMVVGVVTQFVPTRSCVVSLDVREIPPITTRYGSVDDELEDVASYSLVVDGERAGHLAVVPEAAELATSEFLLGVAEQISSGLAILVESERLRRRAAREQTMRLVDTLADVPRIEDLRALVEALALLPHALGARLDVVHATIGQAVSLLAGVAPNEAPDLVEVDGGAVGVTVRWSSSAGAREQDDLGQLVGMLAAAFEKAEERRKMRADAETDALTGIGNRRRVARVLSEAIRSASAHEESLGLVYLDLDLFKTVNDTLGHDAGDQVLIAFAGHLVATVRTDDVVARLGGEEFVVICPGLTETAGIALARRIVEATPAACASVLPEGWVQTTSAGLAVYPLAAGDPDALLRAADQALYVAKNSGRNRCCVADHLVPVAGPPARRRWH